MSGSGIDVKLTVETEECVFDMTGTIEAIIAIAGMPDAKGTILQEGDLKKQADGKTLFWDDKIKSLIYKGPIPRKIK